MEVSRTGRGGPIAEKKKKHAATLQEFLEGDYRRWALTNLKRGQEAVDRLIRAFPIELRRKRLPEINAFAVERWRSARHADGVKPVTTNRDLDALRAVLSKAVEWGALAGFTFHDLRHSFASKLVQAGVDLNTVRELLGHANITMTLRCSHLRPDLKAMAVEKLVAAS